MCIRDRNSEYKVLVVFVVVVAVLLAIASQIENSNMHWGMSLAFVVGAIFSAISAAVVPLGTCIVEPSGNVMVISAIIASVWAAGRERRYPGGV